MTKTMGSIHGQTLSKNGGTRVSHHRPKVSKSSSENPSKHSLPTATTSFPQVPYKQVHTTLYVPQLTYLSVSVLRKVFEIFC